MSTEKTPMTPAVRLLLDRKVNFTPHLYKYEEKGGTAVSSRELGVPEHTVIKTLIMETDEKAPLIVLMHGDCQVSTKQLAREMNVKAVHPCDPEVAHRHSGYMVGGTSPFGTRKVMPVFMQQSILEIERVFINGGKKGFLVQLSSQDIVAILKPHLVDIIA
jgi:Cys-tRNA(Pro) deacylase